MRSKVSTRNDHTAIVVRERVPHARGADSTKGPSYGLAETPLDIDVRLRLLDRIDEALQRAMPTVACMRAGARFRGSCFAWSLLEVCTDHVDEIVGALPIVRSRLGSAERALYYGLRIY